MKSPFVVLPITEKFSWLHPETARKTVRREYQGKNPVGGDLSVTLIFSPAAGKIRLPRTVDQELTCLLA
jgi:hypothetical protein